MISCASQARDGSPVLRNGVPFGTKRWGSTEHATNAGFRKFTLTILDMGATAPFDKAVKHLFRHLHNASALRRNPLVRELFDASSLLAPGPAGDQLILSRIHALAREAAEHCRDLDLKEGRNRQGLRQYAIFSRQCLERQPIDVVAHELGISKQHCYRERSTICQRVAGLIRERNEAPIIEYLAQVDEFRSLVDRAAREVGNGNLEASLRQYELLIGAATSTEQRVEALCRKADAALTFAKVKLAEAAFSAAGKHAPRAAEGDSSTTRVIRAWLDLTGAKFAYFRGDSQEAINLVERSTIRLEPLQTHAPVNVRELYAESLSEVGAALWNLGNRYRAYDYMVRAEEGARSLPVLLSQTRCHVTIQLWKFRSQLLMSPQHWCPVSERVRALTSAFDAAYASGWFYQGIEALGVIMASTALAGRFPEAIRSADVALSLTAQQTNERVKFLVPVALAVPLMSTDCWEKGFAIYSTVRQLRDCERYLHASVSYIVAARALRLRQFNDAWRLANENTKDSDPLDLTLRKKVIGAAAAHELGRQRHARSLLDEVIATAEALGSAAILRDACLVAARVEGGNGRRLRRRASELSKLLAM